ncbi:hypothetical protein [Portibacter lacus]|uniref:DUF3857 domain-containing protein n=1 Tax=Portibacter lacus TaxID=1099794 RepID=A0AA37SSB7_9BACT|nr:hypothetical protein [Portibacter lacus]GLR18774.1 hypothetical protein GCM10007940_33900 [Portibacter lacus]
MKYYLIILLALLLSVKSSAEEKRNISVLIEETNLKNQFEALFVDRLFDYLNQSDRITYQRYHYDLKKKSVVFKSDGKENFSEKIILIEPDFKNILTPKIEMKKDSITGKTVGAYMNLNLDFICYFKQIDLASSQIEFAKKVAMEPSTLNTKSDVLEINFEKYFVGNIPKVGTKEYKAILDNIHAEYKSQIEMHYINRINKDYSMLGDIESAINAQTDTSPFTIEEIPDKKGKKMSSFIIKAGKNVDLSAYQGISIYKKLTIAGEETVEQIGVAIVTDVDQTESTARFVFRGGKELSEAYQNGEEVFAVRNPALLNDMVSLREKEFRVAIDNKCFFCNYEIQNQLSELYFIKLLERSDDFVSKYFIEKFKSEGFIDSAVEKVIGNQEGVDFSINADTKNVKVTNIATGALQSFALADIKNDYRILFLEMFPPQMKFLEIAKQKKDRVKNIYLYSPYGLQQTEYVYIYQVYYEEVLGEKYRRTKELGNGQVRANYSDLIADVALQKNEKQVSKAINAGTELLFTYSKLK